MKRSQPPAYPAIWPLALAGGLVLLNFPFLEVFSGPSPMLGFSPLLFHIFLLWGLLIGVLFLAAGRLDSNRGNRGEEPESTHRRKGRS